MTNTLTYKLVDDQLKLDLAVAVWTEREWIAVDLEFDKNRYRFGFNLCLIQIADADQCWIIDPLATKLDLTGLFDVFQSPSTLKIVFEFGEDIRLLHSLGCHPTHLEDVSLASKLLDYPQLSLVNLLDQEISVATSKDSQMSNWFKRPLSEKQLQYAAEDVAYLNQLRNALLPKLESKELLAWYKQENQFFESRNHVADDDELINLNREDADDLSQQDYHVLKVLQELRLENALKYNRPVHQILRKEYLLDVAKDENALRNFFQSSGTLKSLRTEAFKNRLSAERKRAVKEADERGLSNELLAFEKPSKEEFLQLKLRKSRINKEVEEEWKPIQREIKRRWGENTGTFLLSNRVMKMLAEDRGAELPPYRLELFERIRNQLDA